MADIEGSARVDKSALVNLYRSRAKHYDFAARLFPFVGFPQNAYRKRAVQKLRLQPGDTVVDIGCGTGLNFPLLQRAIGPTGRIVGVDITDAMLDQARKQIADRGWSNVELVQSDAVAFAFPAGVGGVLSTFALTLAPEFDAVLRHGSLALLPGRRWVVLDFKLSDNRLSWLAPALERILTRPFGGTLDMAGRHPWESMRKYLKNVTLTELFLGFAYIAWGERDATAPLPLASCANQEGNLRNGMTDTGPYREDKAEHEATSPGNRTRS